MSLATFLGGVHPFDGKSLSKDSEIREIMPGEELVFPVSQHIGAPAVPIVAVGDQVLAGQKIAEANGFVSANIHTSVSGTVKAIEPRMTFSGNKVMSIVITNDGEYKEAEPMDVSASYTELSNEQILEKIKEAGIVGMGGAGFPTHVKLAPKEPDKVDTIIANCAECEPYLTSDYRRMMETPEKLIDGMKIVLQLFPQAKGVFAIEDNKMDCVLKLEKLAKQEERMEVKVLQTKYPQGSERQLIYAVTKRKIHSRMLPADAGCIVQNVDTLTAIGQAVIEGKPLTSRIVTVTGDGAASPCNLKVPIGMSYAEVIEEAGGLKGEPEKIISGGPMMGFALFSTDVPVMKGSSAILAMTKDEISAMEPTACINCGRCMQACPQNLIPGMLADFADKGKEEKFLSHYGMECVECGCCSYACPAKRHLTQSIRTMRKIQLAKRKK